MNADEVVEVAPRRAEFDAESDRVHDFAGLVTDERRAEYCVRAFVDVSICANGLPLI